MQTPARHKKVDSFLCHNKRRFSSPTPKKLQRRYNPDHAPDRDHAPDHDPDRDHNRDHNRDPTPDADPDHDRDPDRDPAPDRDHDRDPDHAPDRDQYRWFLPKNFFVILKFRSSRLHFSAHTMSLVISVRL